MKQSIRETRKLIREKIFRINKALIPKSSYIGFYCSSGGRLYLAPVPYQKVMPNGFQMHKRIVIFYKFKHFYCALLVWVIHNKEVHSVILKGKMEKRWISLGLCNTSMGHFGFGFGAFPRWLFRSRMTSNKAKQDAAATGSTSPATLWLGSPCGAQPYKLDFYSFYQWRNEVRAPSLCPDHWVLQSDALQWVGTWNSHSLLGRRAGTLANLGTLVYLCHLRKLPPNLLLYSL